MKFTPYTPYTPCSEMAERFYECTATVPGRGSAILYSFLLVYGRLPHSRGACFTATRPPCPLLQRYPEDSQDEGGGVHQTMAVADL